MDFSRTPLLENKPQACTYITHKTIYIYIYMHNNIRVFQPIFVFETSGYLTPAVLESLTKHLCRSN